MYNNFYSQELTQALFDRIFFCELRKALLNLGLSVILNTGGRGTHIVSDHR